jgi:hypothetical protein
MMMQRGGASMTSSIASAAQAPQAMRVDLYQLQLPEGTISRNEKFWKRVDEQSVDPGTYELLYKNGVRVGQATLAEWDYYRQVMEQYPAVTKASSLVAADSKPVELLVRKDIHGQDIWYFDSSNRLEGRSYDACENLLAITFQQAPRRVNAMRVALCPMVRCVTKRLEHSALNNELEVTYAAPQRLYDLNLRADVPLDSFLVIAPSGEATWSTSIGNNFFMSNGTAERLENVLLIVPRPIQIEEAPAGGKPTPARRR